MPEGIIVVDQVQFNMSHDVAAGVYIAQAIEMPGLILEAETEDSLIAQAHEVLPDYIKAHQESKLAIAADRNMRAG